MKSYAWAFALIAVLAAVDAVWAYAAGIAITGIAAKVVVPGYPAAVAAGLFLIPRESAQRAAHLLAATAALLAFSTVGAILSYLVLTLGLPLADPLLLTADRALGFDWLAWSECIAAMPWLRAVLTVTYTGLMPAIVLALIWLGGTRPKRVPELVWAIMLSGLIAIAVSALLPSISCPLWLGLEDHARMAAQLYPDYVGDLRALHDGSLREITRTSGIISFPSYHTALVLLLAYSLRRTALFWPAIVFAALTVLSVPSVGMHYLVDIPGGALVALATIAALRFPRPDQMFHQVRILEVSEVRSPEVKA